jgi:hypothetical protein
MNNELYRYKYLKYKKNYSNLKLLYGGDRLCDKTNKFKIEPKCDGKEDPITFEIINKNKGICLPESNDCYGKDSVSNRIKNGNSTNPATNKNLPDDIIRKILGDDDK